MFRIAALCALLVTMTGCATQTPQNVFGPAHLSPQTPAAADIAAFPEPRGKIPVAVYSFKDQTGQYKASPGSSFSTAVTQGATALLIKALKDSGWFLPVERENLQDILTERKIARALDTPGADKAAPPVRNLPPLMSANLIIEGSIVGYDENVKTGGVGAKYFGISLSDQYRVDQVSVNLRAIDINSGQILQSVSTSKTVYSILLDSGFYRFVTFKKLLEAEIGVSETEPTAICVEEAIRTALAHLIAQGIANGLWTVRDEADLKAPILDQYLQQYQRSIAPRKPRTPAAAASVPLAPSTTPMTDAVMPATSAPLQEPMSEAAPAAAAPPPAATDANALKAAPEQTLLSRRAVLESTVSEACASSAQCRLCRSAPGEHPAECKVCTGRVAHCKAVKADLRAFDHAAAAREQP